MLELETRQIVGISIYVVLALISVKAAVSEKLHGKKWWGMLLISLLPALNIFTALFYILDRVEKHIVKINQPSFLQNNRWYSFRLRPITLGEPMVADIWVWTLFGKVSFTLRTVAPACYHTFALADIPTANPVLKLYVNLEGKAGIEGYPYMPGHGDHLGRVCDAMIGNLWAYLTLYDKVAKKSYQDFNELLHKAALEPAVASHEVGNNGAMVLKGVKCVTPEMILASVFEDEADREPMLPVRIYWNERTLYLLMYRLNSQTYLRVPARNLHQRCPISLMWLGQPRQRK